jgi:hypothetical protein
MAAKKTETKTEAVNKTAPAEEAKPKKTTAAKKPEGTAKNTVKKTTAQKKTSTAKAEPETKEKSAVITNYFEVDGDQIREEDVVERVKKACKGKEIKTLELYYNMGERKCYYVLNGQADGSFVEF